MKNDNQMFSKLIFWDEAKNEWDKLEGHQRKFVMKALQRIEENGPNIGDPLGNKRNVDLSGYRKVKLLKIGVRIVYKIVNDEIEVTEIVAIDHRDDEEVYKIAFDRIKKRNA